MVGRLNTPSASRVPYTPLLAYFRAAPYLGRKGRGWGDDREKEAAKKEFQARREAHRAEILKKYDTDGDGKLSDSEREALRKDMREKHQNENR